MIKTDYPKVASTRWRSWLRHCATNRKVAGSIPDEVTTIFQWQSFRSHCGTGVDSASNRNEYQKSFLGVKTAGAYGWQLYHLQVPIVYKFWSLNLLEPQGPVQVCSGKALPIQRFGPQKWTNNIFQNITHSSVIWFRVTWLTVSDFSKENNTFIFNSLEVTGQLFKTPETDYSVT
jgi:hypothetical protein